MFRAIVWAVSAFIVLSVVSKFISGYKVGFIPRWMWLAGIVLECACLGAIVFRRFRTAALGLIILAGAGIIIGFVSERPCGCLGDVIELSQKQHILLAATLGVIGTVLFEYAPKPRTFDL